VIYGARLFKLNLKNCIYNYNNICDFVSDKHRKHFGFRSGGHDIFKGVPHVHVYCPLHRVCMVSWWNVIRTEGKHGLGGFSSSNMLSRPCHRSGRKSPASHRYSPGSIPGISVAYFGWCSGTGQVFFPSTPVFPSSSYSTKCSMPATVGSLMVKWTRFHPSPPWIVGYSVRFFVVVNLHGNAVVDISKGTTSFPLYMQLHGHEL
jgi:hypothetical protein